MFRAHVFSQVKNFIFVAVATGLTLLAFFLLSTTLARTSALTLPQTPKLIISSKSVDFLDKSPRDVTLKLDNNLDMDVKNLMVNEEDLKAFATIKRAVSQDNKSLILTLTPSGKTGSAPLKISYKVDDSRTSSEEATLMFGYKSVALKDTDQKPITNLTLQFAEKKDLILIPDPIGNLEIKDVELAYEKTILRVDPTSANGQIKLSVEAIGVGDASLKATIKGFSYTLLEQAKVQDVLEGIVLLDKDNNVKVATEINADKKAKASIAILEREEKNYEVLGKLKSQKEPVLLSWLKAPLVHPNTTSVVPESKDGKIHLVGKSPTPESQPTKITYSVRANAPAEIRVDALDDLVIEVMVTTADYFIELSYYQGVGVLFPNGKVRILGNVVDKSGAIKGTEIRFNLKTGDEKWVELSNEGRSATVSWRTPFTDEERSAQRPSYVTVLAQAPHPQGKQQLTASIQIRMAEVKKFTQLKVKLNVMDERTASDLYSTVTANEYYVLIVRLFNDLRDEQNGQPTGDSIIAYSGSMEIAVGLEKKFLKASNSSFPRTITGDKSTSPSKPSTTTQSPFDEELKEAQDDLDDTIKTAADKLSEYNKIAETYESDPSETNYSTAEKARLAANEALDKLELIWERVYVLRENAARWQYSLQSRLRPEIGGPDVLVDDGKWHPVSKADFSRLVPGMGGVPRFQSFSWSKKIAPLPKPGDLKPSSEELAQPTGKNDEDPPCVGTITYRPLTFEMVVNTVDRRDARSVRSKVFRALDLVGTGTSFVTSVAVPGPSSDLPLGLEKYRNLLIPGLDKLFPSLKEQNRQNIVSQTMKPIEEIPYGSDITRVIFVPKKPFRGLIRAHETRISEICPFFFKIEVAVIQNAATVQQGTIVP